MIEVHNLTKVFSTYRAVDSISFEAQRGQVVGFLGPNGAGKTTTMRMLTGFLPPTSGRGAGCWVRHPKRLAGSSQASWLSTRNSPHLS